MTLAEEVLQAFGVAAPTALDAARALGFVDREAAILAAMFDAQRRRGAAPAGFALQAANLPATRAEQGFAPLTQRRMGLYAILDSADWVERVLAAGVRTLQLRIKQGAPSASSTTTGARPSSWAPTECTWARRTWTTPTSAPSAVPGCGWASARTRTGKSAVPGRCAPATSPAGRSMRHA